MAEKGLHSLIRLRKWDVDEKQRALGRVLQQELAVLERRAALEAEVAYEMAYTAALPAEERTTLAAYLRRCDDARGQLERLLEEVRRQIANAQGELAEAYRRLKTFEVTQDLRAAKALAEAHRVETIELNELGLTLYRRKTKAMGSE